MPFFQRCRASCVSIAALLDYYAYNPEAANHDFYTAADLDPKAAMAWWGIA